jgi:DNA-binding CsgD family transcriptional regulator
LTERDKTVVRFASQGLPTASGTLEISERVVKAPLRKVFAKPGVGMRAQPVKLAVDQYRDPV